MEIQYIPSDWGMRYHSLLVDEALGAGSAGPGKSMVLLLDPIKNVMFEHNRCADKRHKYHIPWGTSMGRALHLRRNYKMLKESIDRSKIYFPRIDPGADWSETEKTWTFQSGYKYEFGHCQNPDDWTAYQSRQFDWVGFDELTQFEKVQYDGLKSRARAYDPVLQPLVRVRSMSNPVVRQEGAEKLVIRDPFWVRKRFIDPCREGNKILVQKIKMGDGTVRDYTRIYLPATLADNPSPEFREAYERTLRSLPEHLRKIMLEGDWYYQVGSYFADAWEPLKHIKRPFNIPASWKWFRAMDWGYKTTGVVLWFAVSEDDEVYVVREFCFRDMKAAVVADRIIEIEQLLGLVPEHEYESKLIGPADTQLWEERGDAGKNKAAEMAERGVMWVPADKKNRQHAAERVHARLKDTGGGTKNAGLMVFENCTMTIQTVPAMMADPHDPSVPMKGGEDHAYDTLSYGITYISHRGRGISQDEIESKTARVERDSDDRGKHGYGGY